MQPPPTVRRALARASGSRTAAPGGRGGTDEHAWRRWSALERLADFDAGPAGHAVVVVPHPDDEVLALGGTLQWLHAAGWRLTLVVATDGEASYPLVEVGDRRELAVTRRAELRGGLSELGVGVDGPHFLGLPDSQVGLHGQALVSELRRWIRGADLCLASEPLDGHPDHQALGEAALVAAAEEGVRLVTYPMWAWHLRRPDDPTLPWAQARRVQLTGTQQRRKARAIAAHSSQLAPYQATSGERSRRPSLEPDVLAHFQRDFEVLFDRTARRDGTSPT